MKRIILALLMFPQIVFAQYSGDIFTLDSRTIPTEQRSLGLNIQKDTVISLGVRGGIYGLSVTGIAFLANDQDSYVRVVLRDDHNYEYLVYECFPMLTETLSPQFQNTALETKSLDGITPQSLRIELLNASINLDSFGYVPESEAAKGTVVNSAVLQREQSQNIVDMLNRNLTLRDMAWRAGVTSMAEKSFEEKKSMFGGRMPQLYGFDYYYGGVFVLPSSEARESTEIGDRTMSYVSEWDWRNRHGKNWMTSVKYQGTCNSCYAFATVGVLEAYTNLYYNRIIPGNNLSEKEIVLCSNNCGCDSGWVNRSMYYIQQNGIVNESCLRYDTINTCSDKCSSPNERIGIQSYSSFSRDSMKKEIIRHPVTIGLKKWFHIMTLCGWKTIADGDVIYAGDTASFPNGVTKVYKYNVTKTSHSDLIGQTAWLVKNSWGPNWGISGNGYCYVIARNMNNIVNLFSIRGDISSLQYNDSDIVCEDADGDGLYFWGIGGRPSFCPTWIPYDEDGDDSNYTKGKILESNVLYGRLENLGPFSGIPFTGNTVITIRRIYSNDLDILSNATLTIKNIVNLIGRPTVYIRNGGHLIIDGGVLTNAKFVFESGGKLTIKNGGKIVMRTNNTFNPPSGAIVNIINGQIIGSNDF